MTKLCDPLTDQQTDDIKRAIVKLSVDKHGRIVAFVPSLGMAGLGRTPRQAIETLLGEA